MQEHVQVKSFSLPPCCVFGDFLSNPCHAEIYMSPLGEVQAFLACY